MVGGLRDVITCAEFQIEIFMGYDFTGGRIFDFPIDFSMGLTTVQRYCAACDQAQQSLNGTKVRQNSLDGLHIVAAARAWNIGTVCRKQSLMRQPSIHSVEP